MSRITLVALGLVVNLGLIAAVNAHHSAAMFDRDKTVQIVGTVKEFNWTNPHASIGIEVLAREGQPPVLWYIEMQGVQSLVRQGWRRTSIKPGDRVTVTINPLRDGRPGGAYLDIVLPNGQHLGGGSGS
jgi:hypothetical protein